jgi:hypothetical protein
MILIDSPINIDIKHNNTPKNNVVSMYLSSFSFFMVTQFIKLVPFIESNYID